MKRYRAKAVFDVKEMQNFLEGEETLKAKETVCFIQLKDLRSS